MPDMHTYPHPNNVNDRDELLCNNVIESVWAYYRPAELELQTAVDAARSAMKHRDHTEDPEIVALRAKIDPIRAVRHDKEAFEKALSDAGLTGEEYQQAVIRIGKYVDPAAAYERQFDVAAGELDDFRADVARETYRACYEVGKREGFRVGLSLASRVLSKLVDPTTAARMLASFHHDETADALLLEFSPDHLEPPQPYDGRQKESESTDAA